MVVRALKGTLLTWDPLRPIVSFVNSPMYQLYLSDSYVRNSSEGLLHFRSVSMSLGALALFTNVPMDFTVEV